KQHRIFAVFIVLLGVAMASTISLLALKSNVTYFYTPTEIAEGAGPPNEGEVFRLGGLVLEGSVSRTDIMTRFTVTDLKHEIKVRYEGIVPDLFREGQGVIATGKLDKHGVFVAASLLAKHDENYMPPDVAKALREEGKEY